jgi:hypothetical protein
MKGGLAYAECSRLARHRSERKLQNQAGRTGAGKIIFQIATTSSQLRGPTYLRTLPGPSAPSCCTPVAGCCAAVGAWPPRPAWRGPPSVLLLVVRRSLLSASESMKDRSVASPPSVVWATLLVISEIVSDTVDRRWAAGPCRCWVLPPLSNGEGNRAGCCGCLGV